MSDSWRQHQTPFVTVHNSKSSVSPFSLCWDYILSSWHYFIHKNIGVFVSFFFLVAEWWTCRGNINLRHDYFAITCSSNSIKIQKRFFLWFSLAHSLHCFDATGDSFALRTWNKEWLQSCWLSLYRETSCSSFFQLSFFFPSQEYIQAAGMT